MAQCYCETKGFHDQMNFILAMRFIRSPFVSQEVEQQVLSSVWWP